MPPKRRTLATNSRRSKRLPLSELPEVVPAQLATTTSAAPVADNDAGLMHLNIEALATIIFVAVTEAVNAASATHRSGNHVRVPSVCTSVVHRMIEQWKTKSQRSLGSQLKVRLTHLVLFHHLRLGHMPSLLALPSPWELG